MAGNYSVVIVDDNAAMRQALCRLFKAAEGFHICGEAANGSEAVALVGRLQPDLVVLDLCMPGRNGLEVARDLKEIMPAARIMLYSMNAEELVGQQAPGSWRDRNCLQIRRHEDLHQQSADCA